MTHDDEFTTILVGTLPGEGWGYTKRVALYARPKLSVTSGTKTTVDHEERSRT